jgi:hypothetical protein
MTDAGNFGFCKTNDAELSLSKIYKKRPPQPGEVACLFMLLFCGLQGALAVQRAYSL